MKTDGEEGAKVFEVFKPWLEDPRMKKVLPSPVPAIINFTDPAPRFNFWGPLLENQHEIFDRRIAVTAGGRQMDFGTRQNLIWKR